MSTKEIQETVVDNMKRWQKIEQASIASTGRVMEATDNPIISMVMEIIQRDSENHARVQGLIIDSLEKESLRLSPDDLVKVWDAIEAHIALERKTVELAEEAIAALKGKKMVVQEYLLDYLMRDEQKHNAILDSLEIIKKGMYPYG
jgi:hypothetical protein